MTLTVAAVDHLAEMEASTQPAPAAAPVAAEASPPPSPPDYDRQATANRQGTRKPAEPEPDLDAIPQMSTGRKLRLWWKFKRKKDEADHNKMPCWKQYFVLFVGTVAVVVFTVTVTTLMAIIPPLTQFFVVFTFAISMPTSIILHLTGRTMIRALRRRLALRRGRNVEGALTRRELKARGKMMRRQSGARTSVDLSGGGARTSAAGYDLEAGNLGVADAGKTISALQKGASAFLGNALIDAAPSLAARSATRKRSLDKGVMTRNSSSGPRVSTFLDPTPEEPAVEAEVSQSASRLSSSLTPIFKSTPGTPQKLDSKAKRAAQELALGRGAAILGANKGALSKSQSVSEQAIPEESEVAHRL